MNIGLAQSIINPPLPILLGGFAAKRQAHRIKDDLFVKVMVVNNDNNYYGLITYDLVAIDGLLINKVAKVLSELKLDSEKFILATTHTHSGPQGTIDTSNKNSFLYGKDALFGSVNYPYIELLVEQTKQALLTAINNMKVSSVSLFEFDIDDIASNRDDINLPGDPHINVYEINYQGGQSLIINYACHPTILNDHNLDISGDFVSRLSSQLSQYQVVLYLNGACGDISTRFLRQGSDDNELNRVASLLNQHIQEHLSTLKPATPCFAISHQYYTLSTKKPVPLEMAKLNQQIAMQKVTEAKNAGLKGKELRIIESQLEGAYADLMYSQYYSGVDQITLKVSYLNLFGKYYIAIPCEVFSELTNPLVKSGYGIIGYANGYNMYLSTSRAYDEMWYEAFSSPFVKGQGELLIQQITEDIKKIANN